jgi:prepilin peptidase CpaA
MLPGSMGIDVVMTGAVLVALAVAAREDVLRHRIPNALNAAALLLGVGLASLAGGWSGFVDSVGGAATGFAVLFPFYLRRGMGAGDVKLMAAAGAYLDPSAALLAAAIALVAGVFLAVAVVTRRYAEARLLREVAPAGDATPTWRAATAFLSVRHERFPYAVAIGIGVAAALAWNGSLGGLWAALGIS